MYESDPRAPIPPPPGWPPGIWHFFLFFGQIPQIDFRKPERGFSTLSFLLFFCIPVQRLRSSFLFFCVHSDHLGSRYELSAFGTLQTSVSRQEEVQEHESVRSKFCNSRVFSESSLPSNFNYWATKQILRKMYLALLVQILVFLTFLPGLLVAGPRSEKKIQEVVARVTSRGVVPRYWYFNTS